MLNKPGCTPYTNITPKGRSQKPYIENGLWRLTPLSTIFQFYW
jgi:hypothetical protein